MQLAPISFVEMLLFVCVNRHAGGWSPLSHVIGRWFFFYLWIWFPLLILFITVFLEIQIKLCGNIIFFLFWYSLCIKHPNLFGKSEKLDLLLDKGLCDSNISITYRKPRPEWLSQHAFIIQVAIFSQSLIVDILCIDDRNLASLFELLLCIICCLLASSF